MDNGTMKDGWQRFLDRLKELWGRRADEERGTSGSARSSGDPWAPQGPRDGLSGDARCAARKTGGTH